MYKTIVLVALLSLLLLVPVISNATPYSNEDLEKTQLWFDPANQTFNTGQTILVDLYADILKIDAIFGFGFNLSFDGGTNYVVPDETGDYLTFSEFAVNSAYFQTLWTPLWDDDDTIAGEIPFFESVHPFEFVPPLWGGDLLLGTFSFYVHKSGSLEAETLYLGPEKDIYDELYDEGFLTQDTSPGAFMPKNPTATTRPIPEPATILLFGTGLIALAFRKRKANHSAA